MARIGVFFLALWLGACQSGGSTVDSAVIDAMEQQALIVDVRTAQEYAQGHYPGAINIPHEMIIEGLSERSVMANDIVILYCRSGNRSGQAEAALRAQGFTQAKNAGGLEALLAATDALAVIPPPSK